MIKTVIKRTGYEEPFNPDKIDAAIRKAATSISEYGADLDTITQQAVEEVTRTYENASPTVDQIHTLVENTLMENKQYDLAREYISYRDRHRPNIFRKRTAIRPYEYPDLMKYIEAIQHNYWLATEYNYQSSIQDIEVRMTDEEVSVAKRSMLAIAHIEDKVKTFYSRIDMILPKPEISQVGAVFSESEQRHQALYSHLIDLCGLNDAFQDIESVPCIRDRMEYINDAMKTVSSDDPKEYFEAIIMFSMIIENVSLFSQFFILMSFEKERNMLSGMKNGINASSKEERVHAQFGFDLVNIIKQENPEWWNDDIIQRIYDIMETAFYCEMEVLDWIYENGDLEFVPKELTVEYMKSRFNVSLRAIGLESMFFVDEDAKERFEWFDDNSMLTGNTDFFSNKSITYTKKSRSVTAADLWD